MFQSWSWPVNGHDQGSGGPRVDVGLLVCWQGPDKTGCGAPLVLVLVSIHWWMGVVRVQGVLGLLLAH